VPGNHYDVLGLTPDATARQIKSAYRKAARAAHPDLGGNPEHFHAIALAFETLGDPQRRAAYDRGLRSAGRPESRSRSGGPPAGSTDSRERTFATSTSGATRAPGAPAPDLYREAPLFQPPYAASAPAVLPLAVATRQLHGAPRRPGFWARLGAGAAANYDGENLTVQALAQTFLPSFPAARLINSLRLDGGRGGADHLDVGHAVLAGYRLAVVDSTLLPPGNLQWDGRTLRRSGRSLGPVRLLAAVRRMQDLFPECHVSGWLVVHNANGNPFEPVVDSPPSFNRGGFAQVQVVNPGSLQRDLRRFLSTGPQPNVVQVPVLARLLALADGTGR
jgi:hypothetical protein